MLGKAWIEMPEVSVDEIASHDLTMKKTQRRMEERLQRIVTEEADPPADGMFPVDARWALEWDGVEEDSETARFLRENPDEWMARRS